MAMNWTDIPKEHLNDVLARRVVHTARMTIAHIYLEKGAMVPRHLHDNEQVTQILSGRLAFIFDDGRVEAGPGAIVVIASNRPHAVEALEECVALDTFAPRREDWIRGDDAYLRG